MKGLNKFVLFINLFFLQAYLFRFGLWNYPTNLQEILIFFQIIVFVGATPLRDIFGAFRRHFVLLSFVLMTAVSLIFVPIENQLDFIRHGKFLFFALILSFIFIETFKTTEEKHFAMKIMGLGAIAFGIFSSVYNLFGYNVSHDNRLLGPLDSAVYMAFYLTPFFIYFCIRFFETIPTNFFSRIFKFIAPKYISDSIYFFGAVILGILLLGTKSMGAIAGSFIIIILYLLKRHHLKILKNKVIKFFIAFLGIIIFVSVFYVRLLPAIQTNYSSMDERGEIWETSFEMLKDPKVLIFGTGFGQFQTKYRNTVTSVLNRPPLNYVVLQPHNIFLLFLMQYGVLGLIFLIFVIFAVVERCFKFKGSPSFEDICGFMFLYFLIHGLIDTPFFKNDLMIMIVLFMSIAVQKTKKLPASGLLSKIK